MPIMIQVVTIVCYAIVVTIHTIYNAANLLKIGKHLRGVEYH